MKNFKTKLTSRKFLIAVAGILGGAVLIGGGNTKEGLTAIVASVVSYLAAEGIIDLAAVKKDI